MTEYSVMVGYNDHVFEEVFVEADTQSNAEFEARNTIMDTNPTAYDLEIIKVAEIG